MDSHKERDYLAAFEAHSDALFRHALFRVSDRERAYDLTQDAFLKTWDYIVQGGDIQNFKSFLFRVLNNLIIDSYRKKDSSSLDELLEDETRAAAFEARMAEGSVEEVESAIDDALLGARVREKIPELPDHYKAVLTLRFIEELSIREIAEAVGASENVVSVRLHRGVAKLRELCTDI